MAHEQEKMLMGQGSICVGILFVLQKVEIKRV